MIGGGETFGSSWRNSRLEQLLPVRFAVGGEIQKPAGSFGLRLTREALSHPVFQIADSETQRAAWGELPRFTQYARVEAAKLGAQVWAVNPEDRGPDGSPRVVIAQQRYGAGISVAICMQDFWHWRLAKNSDPQRFDRFWQQLFRYLSEAGGEEVAISFPDQDLRPKTDIGVVIERRRAPENPEGPRSYQVRIEDAEKKCVREERIELAPGRSVEVRFQVETAGVYTVNVGDENHTPQSSRTVEIREANIEFQHAARDMESLRQWADLTGGIAVKVEDCDDVGQLIARIKAQAEPARRTRESRVPAGVNHWVLIVLLVCLCAEWGLRKRRGLP